MEKAAILAKSYNAKKNHVLNNFSFILKIGLKKASS